MIHLQYKLKQYDTKKDPLLGYCHRVCTLIGHCNMRHNVSCIEFAPNGLERDGLVGEKEKA